MKNMKVLSCAIQYINIQVTPPTIFPSKSISLHYRLKLSVIKSGLSLRNRDI